MSVKKALTSVLTGTFDQVIGKSGDRVNNKPQKSVSRTSSGLTNGFHVAHPVCSPDLPITRSGDPSNRKSQIANTMFSRSPDHPLTGE